MTGTPKEVTQKGVEYSSVMSSPLRGLAVGEAAYIIDSVVWMSAEKFLEDPGYTHLILRVEAPETSSWNDGILVNDYLAQPVSISPEPSSRQFCKICVKYQAAVPVSRNEDCPVGVEEAFCYANSPNNDIVFAELTDYYIKEDRNGEKFSVRQNSLAVDNTVIPGMRACVCVCVCVLCVIILFFYTYLLFFHSYSGKGDQQNLVV